LPSIFFLRRFAHCCISTIHRWTALRCHCATPCPARERAPFTPGWWANNRRASTVQTPRSEARVRRLRISTGAERLVTGKALIARLIAPKIAERFRGDESGENERRGARKFVVSTETKLLFRTEIAAATGRVEKKSYDCAR